MVDCERCHKKFATYAALSQHFSDKHTNAKKPLELERGIVDEKQLNEYKATISYVRGPSKSKLGAFLLILVIAVGVIGYVALTPRESTLILVTGQVAPDFKLPDLRGGTFTLSSYKGKSNVLLFFNEGLACQPCLQQMHDLDQLNAQLGGMKVTIVSITPDSVNELQSWKSSNGPQYGLVLSDANQVAFNTYHPVGSGGTMMTHTFILVNESGMIVWRQDYGPGNMYVQNSEILAAIKSALGA